MQSTKQENSEQRRTAIASEHNKIDQLLRVELAQLGTPHIELTVATIRAVATTAIQTPSSPEADDYVTATISAIIEASRQYPTPHQPRGNI